MRSYTALAGYTRKRAVIKELPRCDTVMSHVRMATCIIARPPNFQLSLGLERIPISGVSPKGVSLSDAAAARAQRALALRAVASLLSFRLGTAMRGCSYLIARLIPCGIASLSHQSLIP